MKSQMIVAGLDASIGLVHSMKKSDNALLYDLMEPAHTFMDRNVLEIVLNRNELIKESSRNRIDMSD